MSRGSQLRMISEGLEMCSSLLRIFSKAELLYSPPPLSLSPPSAFAGHVPSCSLYLFVSSRKKSGEPIPILSRCRRNSLRTPIRNLPRWPPLFPGTFPGWLSPQRSGPRILMRGQASSCRRSTSSFSRQESEWIFLNDRVSGCSRGFSFLYIVGT